jgi:hypothetical protein
MDDRSGSFVDATRFPPIAVEGVLFAAETPPDGHGIVYTSPPEA